MIYYRRYIERFQLDTQDLTNTELGVYDRLLDYYFGKEQPIPLGREDGVARAVTPLDRKAVRAVLGQFFRRAVDGWHNKRADHEIAMAKKARANGAKNGADDRPELGPDEPPEPRPDVEADARPHSPTGTGHPSSLLTNNPLNLSTSQPSSQPLSADAPRRGAKAPSVDTRQTWEAYRGAYVERYGTEPVRNARVNGQLASVVRCVGGGEAPGVAAFYLSHNRADYVKASHGTNLLARDAEGLRTQWATNRMGTETEARAADRTQATGNAFRGLLEEAEGHRELDCVAVLGAGFEATYTKQ